MITTIPSQKTEMSTVDALWVLIQNQTKSVRKALIERLLADQNVIKAASKRAKTTAGIQSVEREQARAELKAQQKMVKDSLTRAFDELHSGKVHHDARKLFTK